MFHFIPRLLFIVGFVLGVFAAVFLKWTHRSEEPQRLFKVHDQQEWIQGMGPKYYKQESDYLKDKIKILCLILVKKPKNEVAAKSTWAKGCTAIQRIDLSKKPPLRQKQRPESSWLKLCRKLNKVPDDFSWTIVVNDHMFVILENLRMFLASLDSRKPYYLGHSVKFWGKVYNTGEAGYVLSSGAIKKLAQESPLDCTSGLTYQNKEDYYLGLSLAKLNVTPVDTRDEKGLSTFHPYNLYHAHGFLPVGKSYKNSFYPHRCCSPFSITFHGIGDDKMHTYYYLLYGLHVGGYSKKSINSTSNNDDQVWKDFLRSRNMSSNISSQAYYKLWESIVDDPTSFARHMKREQSFDYGDS